MKLRFLCAGHREWLNDSPGCAVDCWSNGLETGKILCEEGQWKEALPYVGCAYEASEIILSTQYMDRYNAIRFFTSSVYLLAKVLVKLNDFEEGRRVYQSAIQRLNKALSITCYDKLYINHHLELLRKKLEGLAVLPRYALPVSAVELRKIERVMH
ncbi:MAG: hypothetical protein QNK31_04715 [Porticoccus sp.]|nr:hypothetical protein [Porticoccus sp.]